MVVARDQEFDLRPDPRVLRMLGEINLAQWRCLAELIDNAIDGYLNAARAGNADALDPLEVLVSLPARDDEGARVIVRDTGPGMDGATLERAMRAGWSGNDPVNNLGLFGMGANIATARLGDKTTVWTTRIGDTAWIGVNIDFDAMTRQGDYRTPVLTRPKVDPIEHGTEIIIERLKQEQRQWLSKPANRSRLGKVLGRAYTPMLRPDGVPVSFTLKINAALVRGREHCVWGGPGNPSRHAQTAKFGVVDAYQSVDVRLPERPYCVRCWQWLSHDDTACPVCGLDDGVTLRRRHVHGWLGLQRYLSANDYGIDIIRNGRVIEIANKDLFRWSNGESSEEEYPIDDPRHRGRIVGEIHLDHCRVTYTKDRFERSDPAWEEMARIVRGDGPLRPDKAKEEGYGQNVSPLFLLFQAFRRSAPKNAKVAGGYTQLLVVQENDIAEEYAERFYAGEAPYRDDAKWWDLVEEADRKLLAPAPIDTGGGASWTNSAGAWGGIPGFGEATPSDVTGFGSGAPDNITAASPSLAASIDGISASSVGAPRPVGPRRLILGLSREYIDDLTKLRWNVKAYEVDADDVDLGGPTHPWRLRKTTAAIDEFLVNVAHDVFESATLTSLDALLYALTCSAMDFQRGAPMPSITHDTVLASLRDRYARSSRLDPIALASAARETLHDIAQGLSGAVEDGDGSALFYELSPSEREGIQRRMAAKSVVNPQQAIEDGSFLEYAPHDTLRSFFLAHPELFFDGRYWDVAYEGLIEAYSADMDEARDAVTHHYGSLIGDAIWLADQDGADATRISRDRLLRAALAIDLLRANVGLSGQE